MADHSPLTYLFTWNPEKGWGTYEKDIENYRKRGIFSNDWSCGVTKNIQKGDRFFHIRLGRTKPSGIFGSGEILCSPYLNTHWDDPDREANYVDLRYDMILNPDRERILELDVLRERLPDVHWTPQASGISIPAESAEHLEEMWIRHLEELGFSPVIFNEEIVTAERYFEGALTQITVNSFERNPRARSACLSHHGCKCKVCDFDFEKVFGRIGKGFIHVHHLKPLAEIGEEYEIDPIKDLLPVCPNCHAMLHRWNPPYSPEDLKGFLAEQTSRKSAIG